MRSLQDCQLSSVWDLMEEKLVSVRLIPMISGWPRQQTIDQA